MVLNIIVNKKGIYEFVENERHSKPEMYSDAKYIEKVRFCFASKSVSDDPNFVVKKKIYSDDITLHYALHTYINTGLCD